VDAEVLAPAAAVRRRLPRPPALRRLLTTVWTHDLPPRATAVRVLPDAAIDVVVGGGRIRIAGPDTSAVVERFPAGGWVVGFQLRPGAAAALLGVPASALRDERVDLEDLWGAAAGELVDAADEGDGPAAVAAAVEERLAGRAAAAPDGDPLAEPLLRRLAVGGPAGALADELGLGERQLRRRAGAAFGYGPKVLSRVLRFAAAVERLRAAPEVPLAALAAEAGYADQAHFTHETRDLSGLTPAQLRSALARSMSVLDKTPAA
jgi:AraC-like DNA-binding protein